MNRVMNRIALGLTIAVTALSTPAFAGKIERACLKSDRAQGRQQLCRCIGRVADATLNGADQRLAARFFKYPDLAQETRQSNSPSKEAFWERYKAFAAKASKSCR